MHSLAAIIALAISVAAAPQPVVNGNRTAIPLRKRSPGLFVHADNTANFDSLNAHIELVKAKYDRGFANYERNTGSIHPLAASSNSSQKRGYSEPLTYSGGWTWTGEISIGTPGQTFNVLFDTGSSELFVPKTGCSSCGGHNLWNPDASSTAGKVGRSSSIHYGDGSSVSGDLYFDTVTVAGRRADAQLFIAATEYKPDPQPAAMDGLLGMAFNPISPAFGLPVFENLIKEKQVDPVFSFRLSDYGAELYLGGSNQGLYEGSLVYTKLTHKSLWQVKMDDIQIYYSGQKILTNLDAIIDTGTNLIIGPSSQVSEFYNLLGGSAVPSQPGFYTLPCSNFPTISLSFGGTSFPVLYSNFNIGPLSTGSTECLSGIYAMDGLSYWVIGQAFLQGVYTTFDVGNSQVGFAQLAFLAT